MLDQLPVLSLLIWLPLLSGVLVLLGPSDKMQTWAFRIGILISLLVVVLSGWVLIEFDRTTAAYQYTEVTRWIPSLNIDYALGIDGISLPLIVLTSLINLLVIFGSTASIGFRKPQFIAAVLLLTGAMNGVFSSLDSILFYVFWEAMLIPMFLMIGIWGGPNRIYATLKFFLYTFFGSIFMLVALIYMGREADSFAIEAMREMPLSTTEQNWIFWAFLIAFAVKIPMVPVHTWLPDAHVEAPTGGSVILAAIMLKMGGYGFLRFTLPVTPDASAAFADILIILSLLAIVYIGFVALAQKDMKKLIAYSSIAHMGFVTLGSFVILQLTAPDTQSMAMQGAMIQMVSHGLISGALFFSIGVLYDRLHTRKISDFGGVVNSMPIFASFLMLFILANAGLPGTSGFVGEFFVIISSFQADWRIALFAGLTLVLGAAYSLWFYKRVIFGKPASENIARLDDINFRETSVLAILAILIIALGVYPQLLISVMQPSIEQLLDFAGRSKLGG
ncbi:complex I subunit 4 family protein [Kangiella sediminilitoris]|uniref:NADH-quinone oxidoreductase subunit M n=1 Tax=Kangiella sediminilitoris TaxID=1144748 RepID=A0A1B3BDG0_9GAMM|nr:NADH-quinone oxidoreductase subunit M [Kangiella sediminilitoris]AOE50808.1 NADH:ubiquinone oxidoreductase subunit M [Kangiella sediminilitoris]